MTWSKFLNEIDADSKLIEKEMLTPKYETTEIECPICSSKLFKRVDTMYVIKFADSKPMYAYKCKTCGWSGFA